MATSCLQCFGSYSSWCQQVAVHGFMPYLNPGASAFLLRYFVNNRLWMQTIHLLCYLYAHIYIYIYIHASKWITYPRNIPPRRRNILLCQNNFSMKKVQSITYRICMPLIYFATWDQGFCVFINPMKQTPLLHNCIGSAASPFSHCPFPYYQKILTLRYFIKAWHNKDGYTNKYITSDILMGEVNN